MSTYESLELIKPIIKDLLGCEKVLIGESTENLVNAIPFRTGQKTIKIGFERKFLKPTPMEKGIFQNVIGAYEKIYNRFIDSEDKYLREALIYSSIDIGIAQFLKKVSDSPILTILTMIHVLQKLAHERYEGEPATTGFLIYRKEFERIKNICSKLNMVVSELEKQRLDYNFFDGPLAYRYIDGVSRIYCSDVKIKINGTIQLKKEIKYDAIERICNQDFQKLLNTLKDNSFICYLNRNSEIEVCFSSQRKIVWRKGRWIIFHPALFKFFLGKKLRKQTKAIFKTTYALSKIRHGTLILFLEKDRDEFEKIVKGSVAGKHKISQELINKSEGKSFIELKEDGSLMKMLSSDGLTVFSDEGRMIATGIIIDTSRLEKDSTFGGGRTTAGYAASDFGKVIKVSEDGPIDFYKNKEKIYRFG